MPSSSVCYYAAASAFAVLLLLLQSFSCCCNRLLLLLMDRESFFPRAAASPPPHLCFIGRHSMSIYGDFVLLMDPESVFPGDASFFQLDLNVTTTSPYPSRLPRNSYWYAPVEFPLNRLPELRRMIDRSSPTPDQSVISGSGGDDYDVMTILTDLVQTYILDRMVGRFTPPENARTLYHIRAYLEVSEQAPPVVPVEDMLRKVTYSPAMQISESMCPICLEDFKDGEEIHLTPCRHSFHLGCLECSLRYKTLCPLCRRALA